MERTIETENLYVELEQLSDSEDLDFIISVNEDINPLLTVNLKNIVESYLTGRYDDADDLTSEEIEENIIPEFEDLLNTLDQLKSMVQEKIDEAQDFVAENE